MNQRCSYSSTKGVFVVICVAASLFLFPVGHASSSEITDEISKITREAKELEDLLRDFNDVISMGDIKSAKTLSLKISHYLKFSANLVQVSEKIGKLEAGISSHENDVKDLQSKMTEAQSKVDSMQSSVDDYKSKYENTQERLQTAESDLKNCQYRLQSTQANVSSTQGKLSSTESKLSSCESDLEEAQQNFDECKTKLQSQPASSTGTSEGNASGNQL